MSEEAKDLLNFLFKGPCYAGLLDDAPLQELREAGLVRTTYNFLGMAIVGAACSPY